MGKTLNVILGTTAALAASTAVHFSKEANAIGEMYAAQGAEYEEFKTLAVEEVLRQRDVISGQRKMISNERNKGIFDVNWMTAAYGTTREKDRAYHILAPEGFKTCDEVINQEYSKENSSLLSLHRSFMQELRPWEHVSGIVHDPQGNTHYKWSLAEPQGEGFPGSEIYGQKNLLEKAIDEYLKKEQ